MILKIVPEYNDAWNRRVCEIVELGEELEAVALDCLRARHPKDYRDFCAIGLTLQCVSHFRAARELVKKAFEDEIWILIRCITENIIKIRWCYQRKHNAQWLILGTELKDANRLLRKKQLLQSEKVALRTLQGRLASPPIRKSVPYWNKKTNQIRSLISTEAMATEVGLSKLYRSYFKAGSDRAHARHTQLDRFIETDDKGNIRGFVINPLPRDLMDASYSLSAILYHLLRVLDRSGWKYDHGRAHVTFRHLKALMPSIGTGSD
jgi:hypothetical protein